MTLTPGNTDQQPVLPGELRAPCGCIAPAGSLDTTARHGVSPADTRLRRHKQPLHKACTSRTNASIGCSARRQLPQPSHLSSYKLRQQLDTLQKEIDARVAESVERGIFLALPYLAQLFALSAFELQTLVICLAPELHRKYDTLYAYVQDDITRKKPSVDLVLDLLCDSEASRWQARTVFSDHAPLFRAGLLHRSDDPQSVSGSSGLAQFLKLDQRILNYILGNNALDGRLDGLVTLLSPLPTLEHVLVEPALKTQVLHFIQQHFAEPTAPLPPMVLYFQGPYGVGQRDLALGLCGQLHRPLLCLDMERLLAQETDAERLLRLVGREGLLQGAALFVDHVDAALQEDGKTKAMMKRLAQSRSGGWLAHLSGRRKAVVTARALWTGGLPCLCAARSRCAGASGRMGEGAGRPRAAC